MRLTNIIRDAYVRAAMQDVPQIDYDAQAHKIARAFIISKLSEFIPNREALNQLAHSGWLEKRTVDVPYGIGSCYCIAPSYDYVKRHPEVWAQLEELGRKANAQRKQRGELEQKLHAVAYSVTTRKALAAALPEFEKYLPADEPAAARNLPVVTNLIADFSKAGWPKSRGAQA